MKAKAKARAEARAEARAKARAEEVADLGSVDKQIPNSFFIFRKQKIKEGYNHEQIVKMWFEMTPKEKREYKKIYDDVKEEVSNDTDINSDNYKSIIKEIVESKISRLNPKSKTITKKKPIYSKVVDKVCDIIEEELIKNNVEKVVDFQIWKEKRKKIFIDNFQSDMDSAFVYSINGTDKPVIKFNQDAMIIPLIDDSD